MEILDQISDFIQQGNMDEVARLTNSTIEQNISPQDIIDKGLVSGMGIIGEKFKNNEVFVPEMLIAARAMNKALEILEPEMINADIKSAGTLVIGSVEGDLHDIGKNLVGIMFKGAGFKIIDLGVDVSADRFIKTAKENTADFIGLSALLTTTMTNMEDTIKGLKAENLSIKVLVGGAPLTEKFAREIEADGYAPDAASAVGVARSLLTS
ncbi:MAG: corrinoid protein [Deltaproteobacteria bacterium]|nr:corrinoid protein [Deltaproteobacteria bacterium]MBW2595108.1 corrinoid protein [Deltaproteobacteria bacterium]MBW2649468.1 corrinoid protein [Deltaproteobacteria bacterium]